MAPGCSGVTDRRARRGRGRRRRGGGGRLGGPAARGDPGPDPGSRAAEAGGPVGRLRVPSPDGPRTGPSASTRWRAPSGEPPPARGWRGRVTLQGRRSREAGALVLRGDRGAADPDAPSRPSRRTGRARSSASPSPTPARSRSPALRSPCAREGAGGRAVVRVLRGRRRGQGGLPEGPLAPRSGGQRRPARPEARAIALGRARVAYDGDVESLPGRAVAGAETGRGQDALAQGRFATGDLSLSLHKRRRWRHVGFNAEKDRPSSEGVSQDGRRSRSFR